MKFRALFPFGGSGGGSLGFVGAEARLFGHVGRFEALGSIDFDREACEDFERFVGAPAWCADVEQITAAEVRERYGVTAPGVVFMSPPCKGSSRLLSTAKAREPVVGDGWRLEEDLDDCRARIYFDGKPSAELRAKLKAEGWRWSPSAGAWQRQATNAAWCSALRILGLEP